MSTAKEGHSVKQERVTRRETTADRPIADTPHLVPISPALLLTVVVGATGWLLYGLRLQAAAIVEQLPQAAKRVRQALEANRPTTPTALQQVQKAATALERAATAAASPPPVPSGVR